MRVGDTAGAAKQVSVIMDTGSADFWTPSFSCDNTCSGMPPTLHVFDGCQAYKRSYGSGYVQGCFTNASLRIGDYSLNNYEALAATKVVMNDQVPPGG